MGVIRTILAVLGAVITSIVGLVVLAALVLLFIDWNVFSPYIAQEASGASGRKVSIGHFAIDLSTTPEIRIRDLAIGNPDWAKHKEMMRIKEADIVFHLWPLMWGRLEIDRMRLAGTEFHLEKRKGKDNWHFGATDAATGTVKAVSPKRRTQFPVIKRLVVAGSDITFNSDTLKQPVAAHFDSVAAGAPGMDQPIVLDMKGQYNRKPFSGKFDFGTYDTLRSGSKPFPAKGSMHLGGIDAALNGTVTHPLQFKGWSGQVSISGADLDELHQVLDLPVPTSPPFKLVGDVSKEDETWHLKNFRGRLGKTDLAGDIAVDTGQKPPRLVANLSSNLVDMHDLKGFIGRAPSTKPPAKGGPTAERGRAKFLIPDEPFHLDKLRSMNVALDFDGKRVRSDQRVFGDMKVKMVLSHGKLIIDNLSMGVLGGKVSGTATLDASERVPHAAARIKLDGLRLGTLLKVTGVTDASRGVFRGYLALKSRGTSMHQLAAHMDGSGSLVMEGGEISDLVLQAVALDLQQALSDLLFTKGRMMKISCLMAPVQIQNGVMSANPWVLSTTNTLLSLTGHINFATEDIQMRLLGQPKDYSFFNALTAIDVKGNLTHRTATVNKLGVAIKLVEKTLLAPLMPLLSPDIQQSAQSQSPCAKLLQDAANMKANAKGR